MTTTGPKVSGFAERGITAEPLQLWSALLTDRLFRIPAIRTAELNAAHSPNTWMYQFDYASPARGGSLGACHSVDIPFVFGTWANPDLRPLCGDGASVSALSGQLMDRLLAFARRDDPAVPGLPDWPRYDAHTRATLHFDAECWIENAPGEAQRQLHSELHG